ncbi:MAG: hypothetical protein QUS11_07415 [Candidatus Fermentibacter sp.]|nr:hypothetical protein [Candidatus Fermentibacter sp.]
MNLAPVMLPAIVSMLSANGVESPEGAGMLHPLAVIADGPASVEGMETTILAPMEAARIAVEHLLSMGATDVLVCEVHRIEAPLTGYLVDATGLLETGGVSFDSFRTGIRDGMESDGEFMLPGECFAFIARGAAPDGTVSWLPACEPDSVAPDGYPGITDEMLEYEFLLWREDFESLASRYPRPEPGITDE